MTAPELVVLHLGSWGTVTAGPASVDGGSRERRDRLRSAWLATGWEWPLGPDATNPRFSAPWLPQLDLAVAAALLIAHHGQPRPHVGARFLGVVGLGGGIEDGIAWSTTRWDADGDARTVHRLADLPDALAWLSTQAPTKELA